MSRDTRMRNDDLALCGGESIDSVLFVLHPY